MQEPEYAMYTWQIPSLTKHSDWTPLHCAVWQQKSLEKIAELANSSSVNVVDKQGWTPLHLACTSKRSHLIFSHQVSRRTGGKFTPPPYRYESLQHYSELPAGPIAKMNPRFWGEHYSERARALEVLRILLQFRPALDTRAKGFCTALHCAANSGWFSHVALLVRSGASVDSGSTCGPLCWSKEGSLAMDNVGIFLRQKLGRTGLAQIEAHHTSWAGNPAPINSESSLIAALAKAPPVYLAHGVLNADHLCQMCASMSIASMRTILGHIHMPDLQELRASATTCYLCKIISTTIGNDPSDKDHTTLQVIVSLSNGNHQNCTEPPTIRTIDFKLSEGCTCNRRSLDTEPYLLYTACEGRCGFVRQVSVPVFLGQDEFEDQHRRVSLGQGVSHDAWDIQFGVDLPSSRMSDSTENTIRGWLRACDSGHDLCRWDGVTPDAGLNVGLPDRLIEVGNGVFRLVDTRLQWGRYLALSHRWVTGPRPDWVTLQDNVSDRHSWHSSSTLPTTLKDALLVAAWLGFQYIWIDCLCIIQDSPQDWEEQSAKMSSVYYNAYFTLFADCAQDDNAGFLNTRTAEHSTPVCIGGYAPGSKIILSLRQYQIRYGGTEQTVFHRDVQEGVLGDRAWILQERILSRRILHFTQNQIFWECNELIQAEDGHIVTEDECGDRNPRLSKRGCNVVVHETNESQRRLAQRVPAINRFQGLFPTWQDLITTYSRLKLTQFQDKLPAMAGLASAYAQRKDAGMYIAGLWTSSLIKMLAWRIDVDESAVVLPSAPIPETPSFSWAAVDMGVKFFARKDQELREVARVMGVEMESKTRNTFGRLKTCVLAIKGPVLELVSYGPLDRKQPGFNIPLYCAEANNAIPAANLYLDSALSIGRDAKPNGTRLTCLHLLAPTGTKWSSREDIFLVLRTRPKDYTGQRTYQRIGLGFSRFRTKHPQGCYLDKPLFEGCEERQILIV